MWITTTFRLRSFIIDVNGREDNHAERLRKQQEGWQIKSQKHWHPGSFGRTQEHFHTHPLTCQSWAEECNSHPFVQSLGSNSLWSWGLGFLLCKVESFTRWRWTQWKISTLKCLAFSQSISEETLLKPIQSAGSINLIYSCKMFVYPAWKQQLLWIPLPTFFIRAQKLVWTPICVFIQLSVSNLLYRCYSKCNQWSKNWASNKTFKLCPNPGGLLCTLLEAQVWMFSFFFLCQFWICSFNKFDLNPRQMREKRIPFMIWALKTMNVTPLYSMRTTAVMNICVVHLIVSISSIPKSWIVSVSFYHWFLLKLMIMSFILM